MSALHDASVDVYEFIESNYVNIRAESGEVKTQQIKTENLSIHTDSGDVLCQGSLQVAKMHLSRILTGQLQVVISVGMQP